MPAPPFRSLVSFTDSKGSPPALKIRPISGGVGEQILATKKVISRTAQVLFRSRDANLLAGTISTPLSAGRHPAVVIVHGSGAQDRHGYASIVGILAQRFVDRGFVVLQYDKRGVGASEGDWGTASFRTLAEDAEAGRQLLRARPDVDPDRVGLAGSSQAGWVAAKAIEAQADIPFVALLGAAGVAMTVEEQNSFNTRVQMDCAGVAADKTDHVLQQHSLFYRAKAQKLLDRELRQVTETLLADKQIEPWLLPAAVNRGDRSEWYMALETDFDPVPIWKTYRGQALFAHGGYDDATPTDTVLKRVADLRNPRIRIVSSPTAQHLGLTASGLCEGGLEVVGKLDPSIWNGIDQWIEAISRRGQEGRRTGART